MQVDIPSEDEEPPHKSCLELSRPWETRTPFGIQVYPQVCPSPPRRSGRGGQAPLWGSAEAQPVAIRLKRET
jgi:hypothetical protein